MFLLKLIGRGIKGIAKLAFPFFAKARELRHPGQRLRWVLRALFLVTFLVLLGFINELADLERVLRAPLPILRKVWLPLLFLLIYVMSWLIWWLWELLTSEKESSEYPDIDEAWDAALVALDQASIDLTQSPLFLILGSPIGTEEALLHAAQLSFEAGRTPRGAEAPLHIYANRDGIYLTCPGASLLGKQSAAGRCRAGGCGCPGTARVTLGRCGPAGPGPDADSTPSLGSRHPAALPPSSTPFEPGVLGAAPRSRPSVPRPWRSSRLKKSRRCRASRAGVGPRCFEIESRSTSRRAGSSTSAGSSSRSRRPYCPINGILFLIPFAATESAEEADEIGRSASMTEMWSVTRFRFTVRSFAVIWRPRASPGFRTFLGRFPEEQREKVLGLDLPLVPVVEEATFARMMQDAVRWICQVLIPTLVYRLWRLEDPDRQNASEVLHENIQLNQVLTRLQERQDRLFRAPARTFASESPDTTLFGGCYLAATGRDASHEQAFVVGVFRRLLENQNYVSWTPEALAEDADYRRWPCPVGRASASYSSSSRPWGTSTGSEPRKSRYQRGQDDPQVVSPQHAEWNTA